MGLIQQSLVSYGLGKTQEVEIVTEDHYGQHKLFYAQDGCCRLPFSCDHLNFNYLAEFERSLSQGSSRLLVARYEDLKFLVLLVPFDLARVTDFELATCSFWRKSFLVQAWSFVKGVTYEDSFFKKLPESCGSDT